MLVLVLLTFNRWFIAAIAINVVSIADPNRALVLRGPGSASEAFSAGMGFPSWAFVIDAVGPASVRLIARWRCDFDPTVSGYLMWKYGVEPLHFVMERKMLKNIRRLAEQLHRQRQAEGPA